MKRKDVVDRLKENRKAIQALGVAALYLYGSYARDEAMAGSDVDIFVDREPGRHFGLLEITGLVHLIEDTLGTRVDVGTREGLHPRLRGQIENEAIRIL